MFGSSCHRVSVRNTFLDIACAEPLVCRSRRSRSAPPIGASRRSAPDAAQATQLAHLDAIVAGRGTPTATAAGALADKAAVLCGCQVPTALAGNAFGTCRPCSCVRAAAGCESGVSTVYCHVAPGRSEGFRPRPCKGKRDRIKKAMATIEARIAEDPDVLTSGRFFLPPHVEGKPEARSRALAQLSQVAARAYAQRLRSETTVPASSS